jgi:hypothetical protein
MKINRNRILGIVAVGLVAIGASVSQTSAQVAYERGSFTLPCEVRWNNVALPAGDYTFTMESSGLSRPTILQGPNGGVIIQTMAVSDGTTNQHSALTIDRRFGVSFVKELYLSDRGRHFLYQEPKVPANERLLAQGPSGKQLVPVHLGK